MTGQAIMNKPHGATASADKYAGNREMAARIERQYPGWLIMWSLYYREFYAYPRFTVPEGTILHFPDPGKLVAEMFSVQTAAAQAQRAVAGSAGGGMWQAPAGRTGYAT